MYENVYKIRVYYYTIFRNFINTFIFNIICIFLSKILVHIKNYQWNDYYINFINCNYFIMKKIHFWKFKLLYSIVSKRICSNNFIYVYRLIIKLDKYIRLDLITLQTNIIFYLDRSHYISTLVAWFSRLLCSKTYKWIAHYNYKSRMMMNNCVSFKTRNTAIFIRVIILITYYFFRLNVQIYHIYHFIPINTYKMQHLTKHYKNNITYYTHIIRFWRAVNWFSPKFYASIGTHT